MNHFGSGSQGEPALFIDYKKWRNLVYKSNYICMLVVLLTEIVMAFLLNAEHLLLQPLPVYLSLYLFVPTMVSLGLLLLGKLLARVFQGSERLLNAIPILQLTMLCFMITCVHFIFAVTFCTFAFPIFLAAIFDDRRLTHATTALGFLLLTAAQFVGSWYSGGFSEYLVPEYCVAAIALLASFLICSVLMQFQEEKNSLIEAAYQSRLEAIKQLNLDQKTGLYGATAFYSRLEQLLSEHPEEHGLAVAIFDIDDFKRVNDTYGHAKGDEVILRMAELMKEICGDRFFPVRFGGEEFIILFFDGEFQEYRKIAKRLLLEFSAAEYDFTDTVITISGGISQWVQGCSSEALFTQSDKALYHAKASGKNRMTVYDKSANQGFLK